MTIQSSAAPWLALTACLAWACSNGGTTSRDDSGGAPEGGRDPDGSIASDAGNAIDASEPPVEPCTEDDPAAPLELTPEQVFAYRHTDSSCDTLSPEVFVRNTGQSLQVIESVGVSGSALSVVAGPLPVELAPGESTAITLTNESAAPSETEGALTLKTTGGCAQFQVGGNAVDDSVTSHTPYAHDFGNVVVGETTAPEEVVFLYQNTKPESSASAGQPAVSPDGDTPEGAFAIVSQPTTGDLQDCEERRVGVTFTAPSTPGRYRATLVYRLQLETPEGIAEGSIFVDLFASAVDP